MHIIVGIDPGKTSAVACLNLSGELLYSSHAAYAGLDWIVDEIKSIGIPSIIACDRQPGEMARKIAASFNAKLFSPEKEMTVLEKREAVRKFDLRNPHERDACSAAIKAYNSYANKLKQAEHIAKSKNIGEIDQIKSKVIEKYSIDEAIRGEQANRR